MVLPICTAAAVEAKDHLSGSGKMMHNKVSDAWASRSLDREVFVSH